MANGIREAAEKEMNAMKYKIRHAYSPSEGGVFKPRGKSKTRQSMADECDVNVIVKRHYGDLPEPTFTEDIVDMPENFDYHTALNLVREADSAFLDLPSDIRAAHDNDPGKMLKFVDSEAFRQGEIDWFGNPVENATPEAAREPLEKPAEAGHSEST